jgi:hypothetical protein
VELTFTDPGFQSGLESTLAGLLVLVALGFITRRSRDTGTAEPEPS